MLGFFIVDSVCDSALSYVSGRAIAARLARARHACVAAGADVVRVKVRGAVHSLQRFFSDCARNEVVRTRIQCRSKFVKIDVISVFCATRFVLGIRTPRTLFYCLSNCHLLSAPAPLQAVGAQVCVWPFALATMASVLQLRSPSFRVLSGVMVPPT